MSEQESFNNLISDLSVSVFQGMVGSTRDNTWVDYKALFAPPAGTTADKVLPSFEITGIGNASDIRAMMEPPRTESGSAGDILARFERAEQERVKHESRSDRGGNAGGGNRPASDSPGSPAPAAPPDSSPTPETSGSDRPTSVPVPVSAPERAHERGEDDKFSELFERLLGKLEPSLEQKAAAGAEKLRECDLPGLYAMFRGLDPEQAHELGKAISEKAGIAGIEFYKKNLHISIDYSKNGTAPSSRTGLTIGPDGKESAWNHTDGGCFGVPGFTEQSLGQTKLKLLQKMHSRQFSLSA